MGNHNFTRLIQIQMKFIATLLSTTAAVTLEGVYDADGNLLSYPRADGAIQFADGSVGFQGGDLLGPEDFYGDLGRDVNIFNFYGAVYGDVKGIADDDGSLGLAVGADSLLGGLGGLRGDGLDALLDDGAAAAAAALALGGGLGLGRGGRLGGFAGLDADLLAAGALGADGVLLGADGLPLLGADGLVLAGADGRLGGFAGLAGLGGAGRLGGLAGLGGAGQQLLDQAGGALVNLGDGSGVDLSLNALGGLTAVVDGGALEGAPALGTGLGGAAITSAEGGWCGYNATKQASANCAPGLSCVNGLCTDLDAYTSKFELGDAAGDRFAAGQDPFVTLNEASRLKQTADGDMVAH